MPRRRKIKETEKIEFKHSDGASVAQIEFKTEKWTVSKLINLIKKDSINDQVIFQRGFCWNSKQRSLFIHSIIMNYYIYPLIVSKKDGKLYDLLDGKQRASTLKSFIDGKFKLNSIPPVLYDDGTEEDFNGLRFNELPEDIQEIINGYNLSLVIFDDNISKEQTEDVFFRTNNGTSLRSSDKNFSKAISKDQINSVVTHPIFEKAMTETAREKLAPRNIVINSYIMFLTDDYSLDSKDVTKFLHDYTITDEDKQTLESIFDRLLNISGNIEKATDPGTIERKASKRVLGRTNIPLLVKFLNNYDDDEKNTDFLQAFFSGEGKASINDSYNEASQSGAGHLDNIRKKYKALEDEYEKF